jgi:hypothetical protein
VTRALYETGVVLSGGGARAAYQIGVLRAIARMLGRTSTTPFGVICGTSAGAVNAALLAANADSFRRGVARLLRLWRLERLNRVLNLVPHKIREAHPEIVHVDTLVVGPSRDLGQFAIRYADRLPTGVRYLLRGLGATEGTGANLLSYLLFDRKYCRELLALGYSDALARRDEIEAFLGGDSAGYLPFFPAELLR